MFLFWFGEKIMQNASIERYQNLLRLIPEHMWLSIYTAFTYDFSFGLFFLQGLMTRAGYAHAAPAVVTLLNAANFIQLGSSLPTAIRLSRLWGELHALDASTADGDSIRDIEQKIGRAFRNGVVAATIAWPSVVALAFSKPLLLALGQSETVASDVQAFFNSYSPLYLMLALRFPLEFWILTIKKQGVMVLMSWLALGGVCCGLGYELGFRTSLGMTGFGLAFGATNGFLTMTLLFYVRQKFKRYGFFNHLLSWTREDWHAIKRHIAEAFPMILAYSSDFIAIFLLSLIAGVVPGDKLSLWNVPATFLTAMTIFTAATSQRTALRVGEMLGVAKRNGDYAGVVQALKAGVIGSISIVTLLGIPVLAAPQIIQFISGSDEDAAQVAQLLRFSMLYIVPDTARLNMLQALRTVGHKTWPSVVSSLSLLLGVMASYFLCTDTDSDLLDNELVGLLLGVAAGTGLGAVFLFMLILKTFTTDSLRRQNTDHAVANQLCCVGMFGGASNGDSDDLLRTPLLAITQ